MIRRICTIVIMTLAASFLMLYDMGSLFSLGVSCTVIFLVLGAIHLPSHASRKMLSGRWWWRESIIVLRRVRGGVFFFFLRFIEFIAATLVTMNVIPGLRRKWSWTVTPSLRRASSCTWVMTNLTTIRVTITLVSSGRIRVVSIIRSIMTIIVGKSHRDICGTWTRGRLVKSSEARSCSKGVDRTYRTIPSWDLVPKVIVVEFIGSITGKTYLPLRWKRSNMIIPTPVLELMARGVDLFGPRCHCCCFYDCRVGRRNIRNTGCDRLWRKGMCQSGRNC